MNQDIKINVDYVIGEDDCGRMIIKCNEFNLSSYTDFDIKSETDIKTMFLYHTVLKDKITTNNHKDNKREYKINELKLIILADMWNYANKERLKSINLEEFHKKYKSENLVIDDSFFIKTK